MTFEDFIAAVEKGAASIYHAVLATGAEIVSWESNPLVAPLVQAGVDQANGMLARVVAPGRATVIEADIHAALKHIAALDPTVSSLGGLLTIGGSIASAFVPSAAPLIALAESVIHAATAPR